jgi:hypothetical protein
MPEDSIISSLIDAGPSQPADAGACYRSQITQPATTTNGDRSVARTLSFTMNVNLRLRLIFIH